MKGALNDLAGVIGSRPTVSQDLGEPCPVSPPAGEKKRGSLAAAPPWAGDYSSSTLRVVPPRPNFFITVRKTGVR